MYLKGRVKVTIDKENINSFVENIKNFIGSTITLEFDWQGAEPLEFNKDDDGEKKDTTQIFNRLEEGEISPAIDEDVRAIYQWIKECQPQTIVNFDSYSAYSILSSTLNLKKSKNSMWGFHLGVWKRYFSNTNTVYSDAETVKAISSLLDQYKDGSEKFMAFLTGLKDAWPKIKPDHDILKVVELVFKTTIAP